MSYIASIVLVGLGAAAIAVTAAANPPQPPLPVHIALHDHGFGFHDIALRAPAERFDIVNAGSRKHGFVIAGTGPKTHGVRSSVAPLAAGQSTQLTLSLPPGRYEIYSPVDGDRQHGLAASLRVVRPYGSGDEMNRVFYNYRG